MIIIAFQMKNLINLKIVRLKNDIFTIQLFINENYIHEIDNI